MSAACDPVCKQCDGFTLVSVCSECGVLIDGGSCANCGSTSAPHLGQCPMCSVPEEK